jgi:uncharacterized iron-regulated protein
MEADMKKNPEITRLEKSYARLTARLAKLGPVLQGTITERTIVREDPKRPDEKKAYGPYYQWTFKRAAKTVTVNLSREQVAAYQRAIDAHRKLEDITAKLRLLSAQILEAKTEGVKKRK